MTTYKGYIAELRVDTDENIIRGKAINTGDTITFYGKTVEEAVQAFRDSIDDYLEFCEEIGVEPEKPYSGKVLLRMNPELHRRLSLMARAERRSINSFITRQLMKAVRKDAALDARPPVEKAAEAAAQSPEPKAPAPPRASARTKAAASKSFSRSKSK